ncbi:hypothetical protein C0Z18_31180 [Trinickia dabaoshanensis]|uniref:Uncharacterized protein n=1 Tax=Trinickia dabaoshanensis TaxID=564714 RepID=A0A2N7VBF0_9BURK|nr:hypothetical protein [Trinickia dabaoshanensis]PMS14503.1 hypothetical protein C0Z18_31180 [Trinickia dabaoshanensis]
MVAGAMLLGGCAVGTDTPRHAFDFDAQDDSPGVEVLNYQYGTSRLPGVRPSADALEHNDVPQQTDVYGAMRRGDFLYVKWRVQATGKLYEDRVDLRSRLPRNLDDYRIHFAIDGSQLYVYLISPEKVTGLCPDDPGLAYKRTPRQKRIFIMYCSRKIKQIYPD